MKREGKSTWEEGLKPDPEASTVPLRPRDRSIAERVKGQSFVVKVLTARWRRCNQSHILFFLSSITTAAETGRSERT